MKIARIYVTFSLIFLFLIGCKQNTSEENYYITGKIINLGKNDLKDITVTATKVTPIGQVSETVLIDDNNEFHISGKRINELNQIWLEFGDLYYGELLVSKDLILNLDYEKLLKLNVSFIGPGVTFTGTDALATSTANKWANFRNNQDSSISNEILGIIYSDATEKEKINTLDSLTIKLEQLDSNFIKNNSNILQWILEDKRKSDYYHQLFSIIDKQKINWKKLENALNYTPKILCNSSRRFYRSQNLLLSESYIGSNIFKNWDKLERNLNKIDSINRDYIITSNIPEKIEWKKKYLTKFLPVLNNGKVKTHFEQSLLQIEQNIVEINSEIKKVKNVSITSELGKSHKQFSFGANTYISSEEDAYTFIKNIQDNFNNKAIIIDLWATWCAPCIQDMKDSKSIKQQIKELPVEIVYVCTNKGGSIENWERRIAETKTEGTHIYINEKLTAAMFDKFKLNGYPSFLFFNKNRSYKEGIVQNISSINIQELKEIIKD